MVYESELDDTPITFGKYKGYTPNIIAASVPSYIVWMFDNVFYMDICTEQLRDACEEWSNCSWEEQKEEDAFYGMDGW